jgi:FAD/FMN-containing dehydrogenase
VSTPAEPALTRRAALTTAAAGAAAFAIPGFVQAVAASSAGPTPADWTALAKDLSHGATLYRPGESGYLAASHLFDPRFDSIHPAGVAYCAIPGDISTCLAFVRKFKIPMAARCGGHSYAGWSTTSNGLVIDVTRMSGVRVSGSTATVGAGTRLIDFYNGLAAHGRAVPGGSCPTVGISGLTLGGGIGVLGRQFGLTCDLLTSIDIVTADGKLFTCGNKEHSDLFWACRGGGGGNFGVVTSFTFVTFPAPSPWLFFLRWSWKHAAAVVAAWQSWAPQNPDHQLWSNMHLAAAPGGTTPTVEVGGTYIGSANGLGGLFGQLYKKVGLRPDVYAVANQYSYLNAMLIEAGCKTGPAGYKACHLPPGGNLGRQPQFAKSDFFTKPLSSAGIGTLLRGIENMQRVRGVAGGAGGIAFDALGGAINRYKPDVTAFVHRNALFDAQYTTDWPNGAPAAGVNSQHAWLRSFWQSMRPYASGQAYQNYIDPDLTNWAQAYYGSNYPRLQQVKKAYDPTRLFTFPQAIQPA